jgi:hypothetical protein
MKVEITWHPSEDAEIAAQKGMSHNTKVCINNEKYTFSFIEYGTLLNIIKLCSEERRPFGFSSFLQNGLAIAEISESCIEEAVTYVASYQGLSEYPYLPD